MGPTATDSVSSNARVLYPDESGTRRSYVDLFQAGIDPSLATSMLTKVRDQVNQAMTSNHAATENARSPISSLSRQDASTVVDSQSPSDSATGKERRGSKVGSTAAIKVVDIKGLGSPIDENGNVVYYNNRVLVGWRCQREQGKRSSPPSNKPSQVSTSCYPSASHLVSYQPPSSSLSFKGSPQEEDAAPESSFSRSAPPPPSPPTHRRVRKLQQKMSMYLADGSIESIQPIYSKPTRPVNPQPPATTTLTQDVQEKPAMVSRRSGMGGPLPLGAAKRSTSGRVVGGRLEGRKGVGLTRIVSMAVGPTSFVGSARRANNGGDRPTNGGKRRKPVPTKPVGATGPSQPLDLMGVVSRLADSLASRGPEDKSPPKDNQQPKGEPSATTCRDQAAMEVPLSAVPSQLCGVDLIELRLPEPSGDDKSSEWWSGDQGTFFTELSSAYMQTKRNASFNDTSVLEAFLEEFSQNHYAEDILFISPDAPIHVEHIKQHLLRSSKRTNRSAQHNVPMSSAAGVKQTGHQPEGRRLERPLVAEESPLKVSPNDPLFDLQWALHPAPKKPTWYGRGGADSVASAQPRPSTATRGSSHPHAAAATSAVIPLEGQADREAPSDGGSGVPLDIDMLGAWDLLAPTSPIATYVAAAADHPLGHSPRHSPPQSSPVPVAIIDTGVNYLHPDLQNSMWINVAELHGLPGVDDDGNGFVDDVYGWNFFHGNNNPMDDNGHGSHVSGVVAATSNNQVGVSGIAPQARLMALKILDSRGEGDVSQAIPAIEYALSNNAKVITNSWGGIPSAGGARILEALLHEVVQDSADSTLVIASGNDGVNITNSPYYPASFLTDNSITVGAYDAAGRVPSWANYGNRNVHLSAPGQNITSTWTGTGYRMSSGTSMAAPMVSGVAALVLSVNPYLMPQQVVDIIVQTVTPDAALNPFSITGGRLNAWRAVTLAPAYFLTLDKNFLVLGNEEEEEGTEGQQRQDSSEEEVVLRFSTTALPVGTFSGKVEFLWMETGKLQKLILPVTMFVEE
eukprot:GHVS01029375.1.p1 GENE.GHVS01029375.1~~GHVS01029375.1.p1  ORF type:complete len:1165 (+),score=225.06 GHVS01029375.1:430-3495(+)